MTPKQQQTCQSNHFASRRRTAGAMARYQASALAAIALLAAIIHPAAQASSSTPVGSTFDTSKTSLGPALDCGVGASGGSQAHRPAPGHNVA